MDGDIKRRNVSRIKRPTQKSSTLSRKAAIASHKKEEPLGKPVEKKVVNRFEPPENYKKNKKHDRNLLYAVLGLLLFGVCMFALGYSLDHDRVNQVASDMIKRANADEVPRCEVVWVKESPSLQPVFELTFDRELPANFRTLFIVDQKDPANRSVIKPIGGKYTLVAEKPSQYHITVMQDSDVATDDILCEFGPVLVGYTTPTATEQP